jgi:A/G-specific adenine glycosylase
VAVSRPSGPAGPEAPVPGAKALVGAAGLPAPDAFDPAAFRERVLTLAAPHWRDLPWRRTRDPYRVWLSEVMLQQTQVARVEARWDDWLALFPTVGALARADDAEVLRAWQGMGYNRRALGLHRAARIVAEDFGGEFPRDLDALLSLPGVGPSTAAGVRAFAFDEPGVYLETNVRAVFIHELFAGVPSVADSQLVPLVRAACPDGPGADVRGWYYALLDYGAFLKRAVPNPTRRSRSYARQSRFEGSHRQKRAAVLRAVLACGEGGVTARQVAELIDRQEEQAGREAVGLSGVEAILGELEREGFCANREGRWRAGSERR